MKYMPNNNGHPQELIEAIANNKLLIFLGAGASINCGLPSWQTIVENLLTGKSGYIDNSELFNQNMKAGILSPLEVLDKIESSKKEIYSSFEEQLKNKNVKSDLHTALGKLTHKFATTNFDSLIEFNINPSEVITKDSNFNLSKIDTTESFVLKLHGDISQIDKCIIFSRQYKELYDKEAFSSFQLKKIFSQYNVLFIGFSFEDPYVNELFNYVSRLSEGYGPTHYHISVEDKTITNVQTILINDYSELLPYVEGLSPIEQCTTPVKETPQNNIIENEVDGSDIPPHITNWIGREKELFRLNSGAFKVIFITGIGGEGKSALASHYITNVSDNAFELINWRDFKEEDHKFQHKIIAMITSIAPDLTISTLVGLSDEELITCFFKLLKRKKAVFVLDNIDSYIDLEAFEPIGGVGKFFEAALFFEHNSTFIFTCRPFIRHASIDFFQLNLTGFTEQNTIDYFLGGDKCMSEEKLTSYAKRAHKLTNGHALWLSIIWAQSKKGETTLQQLLTNIESGITINEDDSAILSEKVLGSIWSSLHDREQLLLRTLAESVRAETTEDFSEILRDELNFKNFNRALKALRNLNLIVNKGDTNYIELHPLVKEYIRKNYQTSDRSKYISYIIKYYDKFIYVLKEKISHKLSFDQFSNFTNKAELSINKSDFQSAINTLYSVNSAMCAAGYIEEFIRVSKLLFTAVTWSKNSISKLSNFETLWERVAKISVEFGDGLFVDDIINKYESLIENKEEEYIRLCHVKAYVHWFRQEYDEAVSLCEEAMYLLKRANQPDKFNIEHHQALAYRDSGVFDNIKTALGVFIQNNTEENILNIVDIPNEDNGPMFGNVGKCYFLLERFDDSLIAYYKSFYYLFNDHSSNRLLNLGYAALWISQALGKKSLIEPAIYFYRFAMSSWEASSPALVNRNKSATTSQKSTSTYVSITSQENWRIESFCLNWISDKLNVTF
jgi:tetratricopeptide (TPR) repeat protein